MMRALIPESSKRKLICHAIMSPKELHDEIKADYSDMMYAGCRSGSIQVRPRTDPGRMASPRF